MIGKGLQQGRFWGRLARGRSYPLAVVVLVVGCEPAGNLSSDLHEPIIIDAVTTVTVDSTLYQAIDVFVDERQQIWVLSSYPPFVHLFDSRGRLLRTFGRSGEGPGELRAPKHFTGGVLDGGGVEIWDAGRHQVVRVTEVGGIADVIPLPTGPGRIVSLVPQVSIGEPSRPMRAGDAYVLDVYADHVSRPDQLWHGRLRFADSGADAIRDGPMFMELAGHEPVHGEFPVFDPVPLWSTCADGRVAVLNPDPSAIHWYAADGTPSGVRNIRLPSINVTEEDIRRYVHLRLRMMGLDTSLPEVQREVLRTVEALVQQLPKKAPPVRLRCDARGRVWISTFDTRFDARGYGSTWVVQDHGPVDPVFVRFPNRFVPLHFGEHVIVGLQLDTFDVAAPAYTQYPHPLTAARN